MLWTLLVSCAAPEPGALVDGQRLPVVDMHLHTGEWDLIPEATRSFLAGNFPFPFGLVPDRLTASVLTGQGIADELEAAGISEGVLLAVYAPRTVGIATNEFVIGERQAAPDRLFALASLRVDDWNNEAEAQLAALDEALGADGVIGVKLAPAHQHFRMDDPAFFGIYALAGEHEAPVYLHTGTSQFPGTSTDPAHTDPAFLETAILAHPQTDFILGHLGFDFVDDTEGALQTCIELAQRFPNVWLEPSALGSAGNDPTGDKLARAFQAIGDAGLIDRVIYGSDGPQSPGFVLDYLERSVRAMQAAGYTVDEIGAVLSDNFATAFGTEPATL